MNEEVKNILNSRIKWVRHITKTTSKGVKRFVQWSCLLEKPCYGSVVFLCLGSLFELNYWSSEQEVFEEINNDIVTTGINNFFINVNIFKVKNINWFYDFFIIPSGSSGNEIVR